MDAGTAEKASSEQGKSPHTPKGLVSHLSSLVIKTTSVASYGGDDSQPSTFRRSQRSAPFFIGVAGEKRLRLQATLVIVHINTTSHLEHAQHHYWLLCRWHCIWKGEAP